MGVRNYPDQPRAYVDLDGTTFDFLAAAAAAGLTPQEMKHVHGAYRNLPLIAGALQGIQGLARLGYLVFFATKIPKGNPYAATEKLLQVGEVFPEVGERVIITPDKGAIGLPRDILIDDMPEWANAHSFPGKVFKFTGDWPAVVAWARQVRDEHERSAIRAPDAGLSKEALEPVPVAPPARPASRAAVSPHAGPRC